MEKTFHMLLYRAIHAQRAALRPHMAELGLGPGQPKLLSYLAAHGPSRQKQLADYFDVDPAAVSRMVEGLRRGGFVTTRPDESSRRCELVELTEQGREARAAWAEHCRAMEERMLRGFDARERELFADLLARAARNLRAEEAEKV